MKKKSLLSIVLSILFYSSVLSQQYNYKNAAQEKGSNFHEIVRKKRQQFKAKKLLLKGGLSRKDLKAEKQFERWVWIWKDRVNKDGSFPNNVNKEDYLNLLKNKPKPFLKSQSITPIASWEQIGPVNNPDQNGYASYPGKGRVNVVAVDPTNDNIMYAGSAAGGVWKTTDGGANWTPKTDDFAGLGVADIIIDPNNTNILYMATGDGEANDIPSIGIFKSIDGGDNWTATGLTYSINNAIYITDISFAPGSSTKIFALAGNEIKVSTDSGANWSNVPVTYTAANFFEDFLTIIFDPNDANKVIVSDSFDGIYVSTNGGSTFTGHTTLQGTGTSNKIKLTTTANDTDHFYAIGADSKFRKYRFAIDNTNNDLVNEVLIAGFNAQGGYNICIAVSPTNKNNIVVGGVDGFRSTDNGTTFSLFLNAYDNPPGEGFYVHPDHHFLSFLSDGVTVIDGHDGGVHKGLFSSTTGWTDLSNGLVITQSYSIAITQGINGDDYMMGNQDNDGFSKVLKNGTQKWVSCIAGDGTATGIDIGDATIRYLGSTNGALSRTNDGYASSYVSDTSILSKDNDAAFASPLGLHPSTAATIYAGHNDVKKSVDRGANWTALNSGLTGTSFLNITENNTNIRIIAIGASGGNTIAKRSDDDGVTWSVIPDAEVGTTTFNSFYGKKNENIIYATVSGYNDGSKVYKSTDNGVTWTNISSDLPNIVMKKIILDTTRSDETLYVGTELGLYWKNNTTTNWQKLGTGLPNVIISDIKIGTENGNIYVGTYGRGMWVYDAQKYFGETMDQSWSNIGNWEGNSVPTTTSNILVPAGKTLNLDLDNVTINSLEVVETGSVVIPKTKELIVNDKFSSHIATTSVMIEGY